MGGARAAHDTADLLSSPLSHPLPLLALRTITALIHRLRSRLACESGVALAEFALVVPVLILILAAILDFGKGMNYWVDETHMANEAARYAVVNKNPGGGTLCNYILTQGDTTELRSHAHITITFPNGTSAVGDPVKATVTYHYNWIPFVGSKAHIGSVTITATSTMRLEATLAGGCSA